MRVSRILLVVLLCALFPYSTMGVESVASDARGGTGIDISRTVKALREIKVKDLDTTVPVPARPLLTTLKHQLRDLIQETLNSKLAESADLRGVREALSAESTRQGVVAERPDIVLVRTPWTAFAYTYGNVMEIVIIHIPDHPDMIGVTTTLGVQCGADSSLYLFKKNGQKWDLIMAQEANDYEKVSGAQGSFQYVVSPPSDTGQFFVVTKNVNPWCSSNWQGIRYQVMRVGPDPYQPRILLYRGETIFLNDEGSIGLLPTGFEVQFDAGQRIDIPDVLIRRHIMRYQVDGDKVNRVPPFAFEPEGFLDEWFDMPWEEASQWIEPSASDELHAWHGRLRTERSETEIKFFTTFASDPPASKVARGEWQIGIEFTPYKEGGSLPKGIPKEAYFTVVEKAGNYFVKGVSSRGERK